MKKACLFFLFFFAIASMKAQIKLSEKQSLPLLAVNGAIQIPGGAIQQRFGTNFSIGLDLLYKTKKNILFGPYGHFLFGGNVKEDSIFRNIETVNGYVINQDGRYGEVRLYERGFNIGARIGKIIPIMGPNPNSGLLFTVGIGVLQHKIRIQNLTNDIPQLNDAYKKGYDRLTNGICINEFIGYFRLDNKKRINYYAGFEFNQAFTKNRRSYNFDTMAPDNRAYFDMLNGFRIGIIIPFYAKVPNDYYFY